VAVSVITDDCKLEWSYNRNIFIIIDELGFNITSWFTSSSSIQQSSNSVDNLYYEEVENSCANGSFLILNRLF
jgi:hypothetical protein